MDYTQAARGNLVRSHGSVVVEGAWNTHTVGDKREINGRKPPQVIHIWGVVISVGSRMHGDDRADKRELRTAPRTPFNRRLFFSNSGRLEGEATLLDLSKTGCAAESETTVQTDMSLELWIFLPDYGWRMHIDHAVVRWVRGHVFGLEFLHLRPVQRERLRRLVEKFRAQ